MTVAICLDRKDGMLFNGRRQSRDKELIADLVGFAGEKKVFISAYSEKLFSEYGENIRVSDSFLDEAAAGDVCFAEKEDLTPYLPKISRLIVYRWNKIYPADLCFDLSATGLKHLETTVFEGNSHDNIEREVYVR